MITKTATSLTAGAATPHDRLLEFWEIPPLERPAALFEAIQTSHRWHYERNKSYRRTLADG